jgi:hypothetical protein
MLGATLQKYEKEKYIKEGLTIPRKSMCALLKKYNCVIP